MHTINKIKNNNKSGTASYPNTLIHIWSHRELAKFDHEGWIRAVTTVLYLVPSSVVFSTVVFQV